MPQPIKHEGVSAKIGGIKIEANIDFPGRQNAPISKQQISKAIHQINENVTNNPLHKAQNAPTQIPDLTQNNSPNDIFRGNRNAYGRLGKHHNEGNIQPLNSHKNNNSERAFIENRNFIDNFTKNVIKKVFQNNDIYLTSRDVSRMMNEVSQASLPAEVKNLLQNIQTKTNSLFQTTNYLSGEISPKRVNELSHQFGELTHSIKNSLFELSQLEAKPFNHANIHEKMHTAIDLLPNHLPEKEAQLLLKNTHQEVLNALLLTRGLIMSNEKSPDIRDFISSQSTILPNGIVLADLRDVGQLVKILISEVVIAKNFAGLDSAVQKFVSFLAANNEIGVLLATIRLAREINSSGVLVNRTIALIKIYELISRLIQSGEKAMKAADEQSPKNYFLFKEEIRAIKTTVGGVSRENEDKLFFNKNPNNLAETSLRQFLEFNPNSKFDFSASAFFDPDESRRMPTDFASLYHRDIENWLKSGNHRFVKDYFFEKPLGIIVERNNENCFSANKVRIVLVRDGSVQGWHILKSVLVK